MKTPKCCFKQTRQINIAPRKISKKTESRQFYCMRGVIRKHKDVLWATVCDLLKTQDWKNILFDSRFASFGGFSKEEKNDSNIIRYSIRLFTKKGSTVKKELFLLEQEDESTGKE